MYLRRRRVPRTKRRLRRQGAALKGRGTRPLSLYSQKKVYAFRRTCEAFPYVYDGSSWVKQADNVISSNGTGAPWRGIFKFSLQDLPGYTDFTNLYENFKITGVKLRFLPLIGTTSEGSNTAASILYPVAMCIDRGANDNVAANPTFLQLLENQDVKIRNTQKPFSIYISYPKAHAPADGVTQTVLMSPWLDSEVNGQVVDHHGLKFAFQGTSTPERMTIFKVYATYYIKCRAPQ